jgi:uncharacterized RDD family membrane protein YckC
VTEYSDPYAAPAAPLAEPVADFVLAERGTRLGAALIDGLLKLFIWLPALALIPLSANGREPSTPEFIAVGGAMLLVVIALIAWNCVWLLRYGQTPGKRALGIRIVRRDGTPADLGRLIGLRFAPMFFINLVFGALSWLVDVLLIFGEERRCLHDLMADTVVVQG